MKVSFIPKPLLAVSCSALFLGGAALAADESSRTIHLVQDDAQIHFESKLYVLKYVSAEEMLPFVNSAIKRYNTYSNVRRVTDQNNGTGALLVSTGSDFIPYVDEIILALDRPGKPGTSPIRGTGLTRIAYSPRYRAAVDFSNIINATIASSSGAAYVNTETNTIFWRDQSDAAKRTLSFVERLDRPVPQVQVRINYYQMRDSDLKDWGFDYLAWKNGPGVNLFSAGYNAGEMVLNEMLGQLAQHAFNFTTSWGLGGFFTAPQFDMSFIRCLQQSGTATAVAHASMVMINTPVANEEEYALLKKIQEKQPDTAPFIYRISMQPEYQNIQKNTLGRSFIGKSFTEDEDGEKHSNPPNLEAKIVNPFICLGSDKAAVDANGFIPSTPEYYKMQNELPKQGGVLFDYSIFFKAIVERGNTGSELESSTLICGATSLGFGQEKVLAIYEKENDVEQTIGIPFLCRIPVIKYLFSTVTSIKERTYVIVTAEAEVVTPDVPWMPADKSMSTGISRRIEDPLREDDEEDEP